MTDPRLDRLPQFDERSRAYRAAAGLEGQEPRSYTWRCPPTLDQGREGACVGFAVTHEAAARPKPVAGVTETTALEVYRRAQALDSFPDDTPGTSVLAGIKAGVERGWFGEYRWAFSEAELAVALRRGPAVLGVNWHEGMRTPGPDGFIHPYGSLLGGHAILCIGLSLRRAAYRLHNSWGAGWGDGGECWISRAELSRLLAEGGEACVPVTRYWG